MKQVYIAADMMDAELFKDRLLEHRIPATVRGAILAGVIGEIPANTYPTVWIEDDRDYQLARKLVGQHEANDIEITNGEKWKCQHCGETLSPQFTHCWSCGKEKKS